ncbi:protein SLX4IP isoform X2 [Narcine bancroftii]|uniref:protein SLX4IP isoform X2 n=1 Tax=Narcine bancroftii TaxID=1343680 RepID=UPI003831A944
METGELCGNFAVLVDPHILPQGTNKDTSWFTENHKQEISVFLKQNIDLRINQYLEAKKHGNIQSKPNKELTPNNPLFIKGRRLKSVKACSNWLKDSFFPAVIRLMNEFHNSTLMLPVLDGQNIRLAAYFIKRHANLRCVTKQQFYGLNIFPDRLVVCLTPCENGPEKKVAEEQIIGDKLGASEYFADESEIKELCNISSSTQKKKEALKHIVQKSCSTKIETLNEADSRRLLTKALLGEAEDEQNVAESAAGFSHEIQDITTGGREDYVQSQLLLPVTKVEKYIKWEPPRHNCQEQLQSFEQLKADLKSTVDNSELTLQNLKQNEVKKKVEMKQMIDSSQNGIISDVNIISGETLVSLDEVTMEMNSPQSLRKPLKKKILVKHLSHSKRSVRDEPDHHVLTNRDTDGYLFSSGTSPQDFCPMNKHKKVRLTMQNKLSKRSKMAPFSLSRSDSQTSATRTTLKKDKSEKENVPRKLRLRKPKKAGSFRSEDVAM